MSIRYKIAPVRDNRFQRQGQQSLSNFFTF